MERFLFPGCSAATIGQVGGKGLSLIKSAAAGLPVPPGFVLPVEFFQSWLRPLEATPEWQTFISGASGAVLEKACQALKRHASQLPFSQEQKEYLCATLQECEDGTLFAVRSSSPEEDLEGASFAGGYETVLGVSKDSIEVAIRQAFASSLDVRVVAYKREHGFDARNPRIAVVIQKMIPSEVAGIGFSLNPVTNHYDEVILNANWGLGESVVSGHVTPDSFTIDKVKWQVKTRECGSKSESVWLTAKGGTERRTNYRSAEFSLSNEQAVAVARLIANVEKLYQKPIDIEWAICDGKLYLLQARPITTFIPLSEEMITKPGKSKRLYLDATISAQGIYKPLSNMATSVFYKFVHSVGRRLVAPNFVPTVDNVLAWPSSGRLYLNVSLAFAVAGKARVMKVLSFVDPLAASILEQVDEKQYKAKKHSARPSFFFFSRLTGVGTDIVTTALTPDRAHLQAKRALERFRSEARALSAQELAVGDYTDKLLRMAMEVILRHCVPLVAASRTAIHKMKELAVGADERDLACLELALPHNMTTEMGVALSQVATLMPRNLNEESLSIGLRDSTLPPEFVAAWREFLARYGHRGPAEIDIAAPRYREQPKMLLNLLLAATRDETLGAQAKFTHNQIERYRAFKRLDEWIRKHRGWWQAELFGKLYHVAETLGGYRETPKFHLVFTIDLLRQRVLKEAKKLVAEQRLSSVEQVFDLTLAQLEQGLNDATLDLLALAQENRRFFDLLSKLPQLPNVIDSRGLILRPPAPEARDGVIVGVPISAGRITAPVKILHSPDEKTLEKGEILVARATDPGWTPLFINAAGVILEVGGVLQHGALVAREYGLPCVAGVQNATAVWSDGTLVELDGSAGTVRTVV